VKHFSSQSLVALLMLIFLYSDQLMANSQDFAGQDLALVQDDISLLLQGDISFNFSKAALEALTNGLPLAVETEINIKPVNKWYWQKSLVSYNYKLEIQYHALSQKYLVKSFGDDYPRAFHTQSSALAALGHVKDMPLIELSLLEAEASYEVSIRSALDSESLPVPLRPLTYLSDDWRLRSEWKRLQWPESQ
jgi:hypothetical protein